MPRKNKDARHKRNPFRHAVVSHTVKGTRAIYASPTRENNFAMVSYETGEYHGNLAFGQRVTVDKTGFLKFYANGVKMFLGLKNPGIKVFMLIYDMLLEKHNYQTDKVELLYELLAPHVQQQISRSTFYRGIKELTGANFLAPSYIDGVYWINCDYVFRGDRLTLVNEYIYQEYYDAISSTKAKQQEDSNEETSAVSSSEEELQTKDGEEP